MKRTLITLLIMTCAQLLHAQSLIVTKNNGDTSRFPISEISNITFEILSIPTDGLVAYYPFNGNANDESGNSHNGTISGAILSNDRKDVIKSSLFFDGNDDYVFIKPAVLNSNTSYTISIWVRPESLKQVMAIIWERAEDASDACGNASAGNWAIEMYEQKLSHDISTVDNFNVCKWNRLSYNNQIQAKSWYHISSVYNKSDKTFKLFINGELINSANVSSNLRTYNGVATYLGRNCTSVAQTWHGYIDDVRIYNRALTEQEIKSLFQE